MKISSRYLLSAALLCCPLLAAPHAADSPSPAAAASASPSTSASTSDSALAGLKVHVATLPGTNDTHVRYVEQGSGATTLVFVHGWSCNRDFWRLQAPALQEVKGLRAIYLDLPGFGQSDHPETAYTMGYLADGVLAVMNQAKVSKAVLLGHSMGTPVITRFYRDHPDRVQALVAVDGGLRGFKLEPAQIAQFVGRFKAPEYKSAIGGFVDAMFPNPGTEALRDRTRAEMQSTPQHVIVSAMENMFDAPSWETNRIDVPLLVLNAPNPMWSDDYKAYVKTLAPRGDYRTIDGTGHFVMLEKPSEFNAALLDFLKTSKLLAP